MPTPSRASKNSYSFSYHFIILYLVLFKKKIKISNNIYIHVAPSLFQPRMRQFLKFFLFNTLYSTLFYSIGFSAHKVAVARFALNP